jgi:hypothetical protein
VLVDGRAYGGVVEHEWPDRDSREWLLGPRGASMEPWEEAAGGLPGGEGTIAAVVCLPQTAPTIWLRDEDADDLAVWDALKALVMAYDAGDRDEQTWTEVLGGQGHLATLQRL